MWVSVQTNRSTCKEDIHTDRLTEILWVCTDTHRLALREDLYSQRHRQRERPYTQTRASIQTLTDEQSLWVFTDTTTHTQTDRERGPVQAKTQIKKVSIQTH